MLSRRKCSHVILQTVSPQLCFYRYTSRQGKAFHLSSLWAGPFLIGWNKWHQSVCSDAWEGRGATMLTRYSTKHMETIWKLFFLDGISQIFSQICAAGVFWRSRSKLKMAAKCSMPLIAKFPLKCLSFDNDCLCIAGGGRRKVANYNSIDQSEWSEDMSSHIWDKNQPEIYNEGHLKKLIDYSEVIMLTKR